MMRSLFSGVSGLRVHQTKMDVLGNNISNVNTVGYKSSRVTFNEVFSQNLSGASGANANTGKGGVNAKQIGLGAGLASVDRIMSQGAAQRTDNQYDVMIQGSGFFIVGDGSNQFFTRVGTFDVDAAGNLIVAGTGLKVLGWDTDSKNNIVKTMVKPIEITGNKNFSVPEATTEISFEGNLTPQYVGYEKVSSIDFYDSLGNSYQIKVGFTYNGTNWDGRLIQEYTADDPPVALGVAATVNSKSDQKVYFNFADAEKAFQLNFDTNGYVDTTGTNISGIKLSFTPDMMKNISPAAKFGTADSAGNGIITIDFSALTQFGQYSSNAQVAEMDGHTAGELSTISIAQSGIITGTYSNGMVKTLGQIPVARFSNPGGLESIGTNLFRLTANSGTFDGVGEEAELGEEKLQAGTLEMSTVDLASEFTEMITTQRGFQANSRIITTSDEMLQELVNLKR